METYYLVDYESVNGNGIENITKLTMKEHVHIFYSDDAKNSNFDIMFDKNTDIEAHKIKKLKKGDQSLDKQLVSYLGYLLAVNDKSSSYVIVAEDKGYKEVIEFWKEKGYSNITSVTKIPDSKQPKKIEAKPVKQQTSTQTKNALINKGLDTVVEGDDRTELNIFVQHRLKEMGYESKAFNKICSIVVKYSKSENKLSEIHNALKEEYENFSGIYNDVKVVLEEFSKTKTIDNNKKRESQIRSFYGQHFRKKIYVENKEATIDVLMKAKNISEVNDNLLKIYKDGQVVKNMKEKLKPLLDEILK